MNKSLQNWIPDNLIKNCANCMCSFGLITRKSHCRKCGKIFCKNCIQIVVLNYNPTKLCISCYQKYDENLEQKKIDEIEISKDTNYYEKIIQEKNILINDLKNQLIKPKIISNKKTFNKSTQTDFISQNDNNNFIEYLKENIEESNIYESMDNDFISDISDDNNSINDTLTDSTNNEMISSTKDIVLQRKLERQKLEEQEYNRKVNEILNENNEEKKHYNYCTLDI